VYVVESSWAGPPSARFVADGVGKVRVRCAKGEPLLVLAKGFAPGRVVFDTRVDEIVLVA